MGDESLDVDTKKKKFRRNRKTLEGSGTCTRVHHGHLSLHDNDYYHGQVIHILIIITEIMMVIMKMMKVMIIII